MKKIGWLWAALAIAGCVEARATPAQAAPKGNPARLVRIEIDSDVGQGVHRRTTVRHRYDARGRLVATVREHGGAAGVTTTFAYDAEGRLASERTGTGGGLGHHVIHTYDARGLKTRSCVIHEVGMLAVVPNNGCTHYEYDARGRLARERWESAFGGSSMSPGVEIAYVEDAAGRVVEETRSSQGRAQSRHTYRYDAKGRLIEEAFDALHTPEIEERKTYSYDGAGQIERLDRTLGGTRGSGTSTYVYQQGRVVSASGALPPDETYAHGGFATIRYHYGAG